MNEIETDRPGGTVDGPSSPFGGDRVEDARIAIRPCQESKRLIAALRDHAGMMRSIAIDRGHLIDASAGVFDSEEELNAARELDQHARHSIEGLIALCDAVDRDLLRVVSP